MSKSILDNVPVKNDAFPLNKEKVIPIRSRELKIVGHCSHCGNPIYGPSHILSELGNNMLVEDVRRSCYCIANTTGQTRQS